jgi:protoporphyrinogen oxidase
VNRLTYMSNYSPGNAPEGKTSFLLEVTYAGGAPEPGPELEEEVLAGVAHSGLMRRDEVLFTDRHTSRFAYIVYDHELEARRTAALAWCEANAIVPLGRFGHYDYFNSDQCSIAARDLAGTLLEAARAGTP